MHGCLTRSTRVRSDSDTRQCRSVAILNASDFACDQLFPASGPHGSYAEPNPTEAEQTPKSIKPGESSVSP